ncbi:MULTISPECIES: hypothetical protein [unclassified Solwaraspora]|uniref:hypothetical protein n=1 Tax=unclassified Solwaraspora TaxID=2627926 RepID=UPI00259B18D0|nr:hypothetical protein [Solwaraspora sp. WMMA2056]WJK42096.1 hypothetical protein O7608_06810 [Solwaraspora sp. WMMA2056]
MSGGPRTHLVLTVANLDTGAVASASVAAGTHADFGGGWRVPLTPVRDELAAQVKVDCSTLRELRHPAWTILLGRTVAAAPAGADGRLGRLCALADLLCLDLVVEARRGVYAAGLNWDLRFEVPGAAVPRDQRGYADSLPAALERTSVPDALAGLAERSLTAPAYFLRPQQARSTLPPEEIDADQLERRIVRDCGDGPPTPGAQAIWRDGRWRHTSLRRILGPRPAIPERAPLLCRAQQPPAPTWWGEPIPGVPCLDCHATGWRHPVLTCRRCGGHGRRYAGAVVTVTNLRDRATHVEWRASTNDPDPASADSADRWRDHRLPERFRLGRWAGVFGVRPVDLLDLTHERVLSLWLRDGIAARDGSSGSFGHPVRRYVAEAAAGRPSARLLVQAADWAELPAFDAVAALVVGLGLALRVTACELPRDVDQPMMSYGLFWSVDAVPAAVPVDESAPLDRPLGASVQQAVGDCLYRLELRAAESVPIDPAQPVPVPQQLVPPFVPDLVGRLTALAADAVGRVVAAHLDHAGCRYWATAAS